MGRIQLASTAAQPSPTMDYRHTFMHSKFSYVPHSPSCYAELTSFALVCREFPGARPSYNFDHEHGPKPSVFRSGLHRRVHLGDDYQRERAILCTFRSHFRHLRHLQYLLVQVPLSHVFTGSPLTETEAIGPPSAQSWAALSAACSSCSGLSCW